MVDGVSLYVRRGEAVALDRASLDLERGTVAVVGKGRTEPIRLTLPDPTRAALARWCAARGDGPGPLFTRLDPAAIEPTRLTGEGRSRRPRPIRPQRWLLLMRA